ncbi:MAG: hypothetical protein WC683_01045 [bacterium]
MSNEQEHGPLFVPCKPHWFDLIRLVQMTVYVARAWWATMREEDEHVFVGSDAAAKRQQFLSRIWQGLHWILRDLDIPKEQALSLTFDSTLWPTDKPDRQGRILGAKFAIRIGPDYLPIEVDCGAPLDRCTFMWSSNYHTWDPVNVFHVRYVDQDRETCSSDTRTVREAEDPQGGVIMPKGNEVMFRGVFVEPPEGLFDALRELERSEWLTTTEIAARADVVLTRSPGGGIIVLKDRTGRLVPDAIQGGVTQ